MQSPAPGMACNSGPGCRGGGAGVALRDPMLVAVVAATLVHILLLLGIGMELPEPTPPAVRTLEVMTVEQPSNSVAPLAGAVRAPVTRAGETSVALPETASGTAPDAPEPPPELALDAPPPAEDVAAAAPEDASAPAAPQRGPELPGDIAAPAGFSEPRFDARPDTRPANLAEILSGIGREIPLPNLPSPAADLARAPDARATDVFASRSAEIAELTARINAREASQAGRPRRKAISTNTREYRYAAYMEAWRRKVEAIGNLNYPQAAKEQGLFGSLILHVAIKADGELEDVRVVRSSGFEVLDEAAIRIVQLAAPYAPFPEDIRAETDVLDITRVWQFQRNHRLGWD